MHIFEQEIKDGLSDQLSASASITYASFVEPCAINSSLSQQYKKLHSIASYDDSDLYYVQSILVSSSWNKNDDIFDKVEVWKARNTPEHKPTNLEHNEDIIIGHIISNWPITEDGELIPDNTDINDLPNKYHILTGSVIYTGFSNPELRERSNNLIAEIENGTKYVSMECFFKGFDYGVLNSKTNEYKILNRNNSTAHLTKFLKAYGGTGQHDDYKIGRVLRGITFTGKGFVNKPANSDSIIFTKHIFSENNNIEEKNQKIEQSGVSISQSNINSENIIMSSAQEINTTEVTQVETTSVVDTNNDTVVAALTSEITELQSLKTKLEAEIVTLKEQNEQVVSTNQEALAFVQHEVENLKKELVLANEAVAAYKMKEEEAMKKEKKMKRKASLLEYGIDEETAASVVDRFESMEDETFAALTNVFAAMNKKKTVKEEMVEEEDKSTKASTQIIADPTVLETAEVAEEVNLSVGGEVESEIDSTRAALVEFVRSKIGKKVK